MSYLHIVFDGPPSPEAPGFVEVEDANGCSVRLGEWIEREDGYWVIQFDRDDVDRCVNENSQLGVGG